MSAAANNTATTVVEGKFCEEGRDIRFDYASADGVKVSFSMSQRTLTRPTNG